MANAEQIGRRNTRNYTGDAFPDGYLDIGNLAKLKSLDSELRRTLAEFRTGTIVYDEEATAYTENEKPTEPRTEPVMLHRWKGVCHGEVPQYTGSQRGFDTVGLKIILRGRGHIQDMVRKILNAEPDESSTQECETYSFGCKNPGIENWQ